MSAAELEALDAARYRWLRDKSVPPHNFYISVPDEFASLNYSAREVDAYIDAAISALTKRSPEVDAYIDAAISALTKRNPA